VILLLGVCVCGGGAARCAAQGEGSAEGQMWVCEGLFSLVQLANNAVCMAVRVGSSVCGVFLMHDSCHHKHGVSRVQ
jgi:hypothetical protein